MMMKVGILAEVTGVQEGVIDTIKEAPGKAINAVKNAAGTVKNKVVKGVKKAGKAIDNKIDDFAAASGKTAGCMAAQGANTGFFQNKAKTYNKAYFDYYNKANRVYKDAKDIGKRFEKEDQAWDKQHKKDRRAYK